MPYLTPEERVGTVLADRYRIDRVIGSGGMGVVFHATHTWTNRSVALKVLLPHYVDDERISARFLQEAKAAATLRHPNVVDVLDMGRAEDGTVYLAMELLEGCPLSYLLQGRASLSVELTIGLLLPLLDALGVAHDAGIVHRDLKPDNIFLARSHAGEWVPKLLDFGIAKLSQGSDVATRTGVVLGTTQYMAPEQASGDRTATPADVWAMGIVAYECLHGTGPFHGENHMGLLVRLANSELQSLGEVAPTVHEAIVEVIDGALRIPVDERHETGAQFAEALRSAVDTAGVVASLEELDAALPKGLASDPAPQTPERPPPSGNAAFAQTARSLPPTSGRRVGRQREPSTPRAASKSAAHAKARRVTVVRPYGARMRSRVFPLLQRCGLAIADEDVIPTRTSNAAAVRIVLASKNPVLLVPFHSHRDSDGQRVDGLEFVAQLNEACDGPFRWKVIMPVSAFAKAGVTLRLGGGSLLDALRPHLLFLDDDTLEDDALLRQVRAHVAGSWTGASLG